MPDVEVKIKPDPKELKRKLEKKKKHVRDGLSTAFKKVSIYLDQWVQKNFKTEGKNVAESGWKPFKYPKWGRHITGQGWDKSAKLLQDTGVLRASVLPFHNAMDAGIGSDVKYAKTHDQGLGHVPQRRIIPRHKEDKDVVRKAHRILDKEINKATLK